MIQTCFHCPVKWSTKVDFFPSIVDICVTFNWLFIIILCQVCSQVTLIRSDDDLGIQAFIRPLWKCMQSGYKIDFLWDKWVLYKLSVVYINNRINCKNHKTRTPLIHHGKKHPCYHEPFWKSCHSPVDIWNMLIIQIRLKQGNDIFSVDKY